MAKTAPDPTGTQASQGGSKGEPKHAREIPEHVDESALDRAAFRKLAGPGDDPETPEEDGFSDLVDTDDLTGGESPETPAAEPEDPELEGEEPEPGFDPITDEAPAPPVTQVERTPAGKPGFEDGPERREAIAIARTVLQRDGWKADRIDKVIGNLSTDELREQTTEFQNRQRGYDRLGNAVHNQPAKPPKGQPAGEPEDQLADLSDLTGAQRKLVERFIELGDEDTARLQVEEMRERNSSSRREGSSAQPASRQTEARSTAQVVADLREPLDRLQRLYPQLADGPQRAALIERVDRLIRSGVIDDNDSIATALEHGARVQFGDPQSSQRAKRAQHHRESVGQPSRQTLNAPAAAAAPVSERDADKIAFRRLARGEDPKVVQRQRETMKVKPS